MWKAILCLVFVVAAMGCEPPMDPWPPIIVAGMDGGSDMAGVLDLTIAPDLDTCTDDAGENFPLLCSHGANDAGSVIRPGDVCDRDEDCAIQTKCVAKPPISPPEVKSTSANCNHSKCCVVMVLDVDGVRSNWIDCGGGFYCFDS